MTTQSTVQSAPPELPDAKMPRLKLFKNLNIGARLIIGFGILVILTLIVVGLGYYGSVSATTNINSTGDIRVPTALTSARAESDLLEMLGDVRGYLALGDQNFRTSYNQSKADFEANLAELEALSSELGPANQQKLVELKSTFAQWSEFPEPLFDLRDDQLDREPAYRLLVIEGTQSGGTVLIGINDLIDAQGRREA
ncbi:MAG: CHASE3 domain-containing protein [Chloroflexota bacterium]